MWEIVELGSRRYEDQKEITLASRSRFSVQESVRRCKAKQRVIGGLTICTRH